jgi:membrane protein DedA with SNARE-associated domain/rhodanese-related sulfurtransferase
VTPALIPMSSQLGLSLVVGNVLLDQLGLPVPAIPTLVVAGAVAAERHWWGAELFLIAVLGCVLADLAWYVAGRHYGNRVMKMLCWISLTPDSCVSDTQKRFEQWGPNAIIIAKFIPGFALIAPPLAGAMRMRWPRFIFFSTLGAALWIGCFLILGMLFKAQIDRLLPVAREFGVSLIALIFALLAGYIAYKWWERRRFYSALRMARISVMELRELLDSGAAPLIVDVRSPGATALEFRRIPGALNVPLDQVGKHVRDLPRDRDLILYCTCPNEASAAQAAKLLKNHGFSRVRPLHGGLDAWVAAGYAVEPLSLVAVDDVTARPV